jgi:MFS transporter, DHA3 family, macrolide efflux protein
MRILRPLRGVPVALLWGGMSLSALGDQLYAVALTWIAVGVLGSNAGYLTALQAFVALAAVLGIGRWADRWDHKRGMIGADIARAAVLVLVVAVWWGTGVLSVVQLAGAIVVLAVGQAVFQPALQSLLPSLVTDARLLPAANGLLDATDRSARLLGPGVVALLAGVVPMMHFLTLDAISFLASATALLLIGRWHSRPPATVRITGSETIWHGIVRGVRATSVHPLLGYFLATTGLLSGTWFAVFFLGLPLMIARQAIGSHNGGLGAYGLVLTAYGCTNLAANVIFGSRVLPARPQFQMFGGNFVVGCGMALLGLANFLPAAWLVPGFAAAAALAGAGGPMKDIPVAVLRQVRLDPADMAAAVRVYMAANNAGTLIAMLIMPGTMALVGVVPVVLGCGAAYIAIGAIGLIRHAAWVEATQEQPA